jgi:hypothetical protein
MTETNPLPHHHKMCDDEPGHPDSEPELRTDFVQDNHVDTSDLTSIESSKLKVTYAGGRRASTIDSMQFYDGRDTKERKWKTLFPLNLNRGRRIAAAMSILCKETVDDDGNALDSKFAAHICEILLGDMEEQRVLNSMTNLYQAYGAQSREDGYLRKGRQEIRSWYHRNQNEVTTQSNWHNPKVVGEKSALKRHPESEPDAPTSSSKRPHFSVPFSEDSSSGSTPFRVTPAFQDQPTTPRLGSHSLSLLSN